MCDQLIMCVGGPGEGAGGCREVLLMYINAATELRIMIMMKM